MNSKREPVAVTLDDGGPIVLWGTPIAGRPKSGLVVHVELCPDPACDCREVTVRALAVDERFEEVSPSGRVTYGIAPGGTAAPPPTGRLAARVDLDAGTASLPDEAPPQWQDPSLLAQLRERLTEGLLLDVLRRRWRAGRTAERERWRTRDWSWWEAGTLLSWAEVFPDDPHLLFRENGDTYWAEDYYCANPACSCREVLLRMVRVEGTGTVTEGEVSVDVRRMKPRSAEDDAELPDRLRLLWQRLRASRPDLKRELRDRYDGIRAIAPDLARLGGHARAREAPPTDGERSRRQPPPGRNAPCPCGSGKKYKKCCQGR